MFFLVLMHEQESNGLLTIYWNIELFNTYLNNKNLTYSSFKITNNFTFLYFNQFLACS